jgi:hypothetical protein
VGCSQWEYEIHRVIVDRLEGCLQNHGLEEEGLVQLADRRLPHFGRPFLQIHVRGTLSAERAGLLPFEPEPNTLPAKTVPARF